MSGRIVRPPVKVRRALKEMGCRKIEWNLFDEENEKWFGYCMFGAYHNRIALTVALVTGKACIELLAPLHNEDVLL